MASRSHTAATAPTPNPIARKSLFERSRCDTSLGLLTQRFAEMLSRSADGVLDLNLVAQQLNAPKRRVYDVTNVLEGIHLIKKKSKNFIEWLGGDSNVRIDEELKALVEEERRLDELIQSCTKQVHQLCDNQNTRRFAYLTYEDVQRIPSLKEQTVIVIKAPAETKLEVPHPEESLQVHLSSTQGPIEAFLCSDDPVPMEAVDGSANGNHGNPLVPYSSFVQVSSKAPRGPCSPRDEDFVSGPELCCFGDRLPANAGPIRLPQCRLTEADVGQCVWSLSGVAESLRAPDPRRPLQLPPPPRPS
ncbi:transcription factor E2F3 isoform X2 [Gasterosteus aculeatus]